MNKLYKAYRPAYYLTDDYHVYTKLLPPERHKIGKHLTYTIEQHNSDTRHYGTRFKRKSKAGSKKAECVEKQIRTTEWTTKQSGLELLASQYLFK
jgi:IS1 family transposase